MFGDGIFVNQIGLNQVLREERASASIRGNMLYTCASVCTECSYKISLSLSKAFNTEGTWAHCELVVAFESRQGDSE